MIDTLPELMEYLEMRGDKYGIPAEELLDAIPEDARTPEVAYKYMQEKDISHKVPLSEGGDPAGDNWILEDSSVNRARGAETMTAEEEAAAHADGEADARRLADEAKKVGKVVILGGAMTGGSSIVEGAIVAGQAAGTIAAGAAEATFITTVVVPAVVTTAIIGGTGYLGYRVIKYLSRRGKR